jgi:hypothetical protein
MACPSCGEFDSGDKVELEFDPMAIGSRNVSQSDEKASSTTVSGHKEKVELVGVDMLEGCYADAADAYAAALVHQDAVEAQISANLSSTSSVAEVSAQVFEAKDKLEKKKAACTNSTTSSQYVAQDRPAGSGAMNDEDSGEASESTSVAAGSSISTDEEPVSAPVNTSSKEAKEESEADYEPLKCSPNAKTEMRSSANDTTVSCMHCVCNDGFSGNGITCKPDEMADANSTNSTLKSLINRLLANSSSSNHSKDDEPEYGGSIPPVEVDEEATLLPTEDNTTEGNTSKAIDLEEPSAQPKAPSDTKALSGSTYSSKSNASTTHPSPADLFKKLSGSEGWNSTNSSEAGNSVSDNSSIVQTQQSGSSASKNQSFTYDSPDVILSDVGQIVNTTTTMTDPAGNMVDAADDDAADEADDDRDTADAKLQECAGMGIKCSEDTLASPEAKQVKLLENKNAALVRVIFSYLNAHSEFLTVVQRFQNSMDVFTKQNATAFDLLISDESDEVPRDILPTADVPSDNYTMVITILNASDVLNADHSYGHSDPYAEVNLTGSERCMTDTKKNAANPVWNKVCHTQEAKTAEQWRDLNFQFSVKDHDSWGVVNHDDLGSPSTKACPSLSASESCQQTLQLKAGFLHVKYALMVVPVRTDL